MHFLPLGTTVTSPQRNSPGRKMSPRLTPDAVHDESGNMVQRRKIVTLTRSFPSALLLKVHESTRHEEPAMIKPIMKSEFLLRLPSEDAGPDDAATGQDLLDTLHEHEHECVGLAANMIGVRKRIICVKDGNRALLMYTTRRFLSRSTPTRRAKDVFRSSASVPVPDIAALRLSIWTRTLPAASKTSRATPPRSSSTKSTTAKE